MSIKPFEGYRLSPQQQRVWQVQEASSSLPFRARCAVLIEGELDTEELADALHRVVAQNDILRTTFSRLPGIATALQVVNEDVPTLRFDDLRGLDEMEQSSRLEAIWRDFIATPFDLEHGPVLHLLLLPLAADRHVLFIALPALCADAVALRNFVRELGQSFEKRGREEEGPLQYSVFAEWQHELLRSEDAAVGREFWQSIGVPDSEPHLAFERRVDHASDFEPRKLTVEASVELTASIAESATRAGVSESDFLLACWNVLLGRLTSNSEMLVAVNCNGRLDEELEKSQGIFERYLPVRNAVGNDTDFCDLLQAVETSVREANEWQECFTWELLSRPAPGADGVPFLPFAFDYATEPPPQISAGLSFTILRLHACTERFKLRLSCVRRGDTLITEFHYDNAVLHTQDVERLSRQYHTLLESACRQPAAPLDALELLTDEELRRVLYEFNDTRKDFAVDARLHKLFEAQVERTPDATALIFEGEQLSYKTLNERANRIANYLRKLGVGPDVTVGLCAERSLELVAGLLGVLKAGGAYLPLDPGYPKERIGFIVSDARPALLLTQTQLADGLREHEVPLVILDEPGQFATENTSNPEAGATTTNLAYVIYTSGSTGRPKGVMIPHGAIANRLLWMQSLYPLTAEDRLLQKTSVSFDASVWELFVPLMSGATLVLARPGGHQDSAYMVQAVREQKITVLQLVPSMLRVFLSEPGVEECTSLRRVFCGGEALPAALVDQFYSLLNAELCNLYGPTEVSIDATSYPCRPGHAEGIVPIGKPLANVQVYLLNEYLRAVPIGAPGEIYVGGAGLARGYFERPDLTAEKFVPDPFASAPGSLLYRTGDVGRRQSDGTIEFLGRVDHQVKVRGFRIELGEIESVLRQHPGVRDAVALAREDEPGNQRLVAYVVAPDGNGRVDTNGDGNHLYRLPNELEITHLNKNETDLLYTEIFDDEEYLKHGVTLADGDCVFDVGANIGLFTLFVHSKCRGARVFSFEPSPPTFSALKSNVESYRLNVKPYQCALSDREGSAPFTFYPKVSASSGLYANVAEDAGVTRAFINNQGELGQYADELLEKRFESVTYNCQLRTISDIIRENGVERIDLLKVDVEKSELDVLQGIEERDWPRIKQVVLEVHDVGGRLQAVKDILQRHGFEIAVDQYLSFEHTGLYNVYAVHPSRASRPHVATNGDAPPLAVAARVSVASLLPHLNERLPDYMVPSAFVMLDSLPLTPNGKVDRNALPAPERVHATTDPVAPRTPLEELVASIWSRVLGVDRVGLNDNFFDLGGHSLLATQVISRLREYLQQDVPLNTIFEAETVAELAAHLEVIQKTQAGLAEPPLESVSRTEPPPLSFAQQRLWFIDQLELGNIYYNIPVTFRLRGPLDVDLLESTLNEIVRRHETLRTTFAEGDEQPVQVIAESLQISLDVIDLTDLAAGERHVRAREIAAAEAAQPFDLATGPLLRAQLLRLNDDDHVAVVTMHHVISDGWSMGVLVKEVMAIYEAFRKGEASPLPELTIQYADYTAWQRGWLHDEPLERLVDYWRGQLEGAPRILELPTDHPVPPVQSYRGARLMFRLPDELAHSIRELSRQEGTTVFMTLFAAFASLLNRYSNQDDILIGTDVANRNRVETEGLIGFFVNQLVLRADLSGNPSFRELLRRVREVTLGAYAHQDLPFEKLVEVLKPERDAGRTPLFQVRIVLQNAPFESLELPGLTLSSFSLDEGKSDTYMTLFLREAPEGFEGVLEYSTDLFEAETAARMVAHYGRLLEAAVAEPARSLATLPMLAEAERRELLVEWNNTAVDYPSEQCLHTLFEQQVARTPDAVALSYEGQELSYRELNERANRLAQRLQTLGVGPECVVGVCMERSVEMVLALLGTLKAGGAYLPLEPTYPRERLALMVTDARSTVLLTQPHLRELLPETETAVLELAEGWGADDEQPIENVSSGVLPGNAAYVIYTSGSTGRPKAVVNLHRAIGNRLLWMQDEYRLTSEDTVLQKTPFSFDVSVWEFFWPLLTGARLVIARPGGHQDPAYLVRLIKAEQVTVLHFVPAMLQVFLEEAGVEECESLRDVICSGEALPYGLQERFFDRLAARLHNLYGPTEAAVDVTYWECLRGDDRRVVPIGKPIANTQIYLLDERMEPAPIGVAGELHIGGIGLARGYLGRPELTAEKFIPDPHATNAGARLYRTGDLARYLADGSIEFLGRLDHQVKLRGFRIELSEIEALAGTHDAVAESVVTLKTPKRANCDGESDHRLICYVVPDAVAARAVRRRLRFEREGLLDQQPHLELPNGMLVLGRNRQEAGFMYDEIFAARGYLRHGIELHDGACVFDVGANIGLFTLFVATEFPGARVYSFEPIPELYELLRLNADLYTTGSQVFDYGLGASEQEVTFTYYPNVSIISGRHADDEQEQEVVRRFLSQQQEDSNGFDDSEIAETVRQRLEHRQVAARLRPLSDVIRELGVEQIDLLKIDVEKSEEEVLAGLRNDDWARIRQVVMEVHDEGGRVARVSSDLRERGYEVVVEQDEALRGTGLYNLYARRPSAATKHSPNGARKLWLSPQQLTGDLEAYLRKRLPEFMVPSDFVLLDELPLSSNGKVNRRALPEPERSTEPRASYVAPRTPVEEVVANVWSEVLGIERAGAHDNFFALGGHSLLATRVVSRLKKAFPVELELRQIFDAPTVAGLAALLERNGANGTVAEKPLDIPRRQDASGGRLSFAQQRLWFLDQFEPGNTAYNMRAAVRLRGRLDVVSLERALTEVIRRHESLRTTIVTLKGEPRQLVHEARPCELSFQDLSTLPDAQRDAEVERLASEDAGRPFDLSAGPLLRTKLLRLDAEEHALLVTMHHIISDGWSVAVFIRELKTLYAAYAHGAESDLPELLVQYADYAEWQREWLQGETLERYLGYWREQLKDAPNTLDLPTDRRRPAQPGFRVAAETIKLSTEQTEALRHLSRAENVTLFMTLLAAFKLLLYRHTGQDDIVVGTPVAGRTRDEVEGLIGFFINTLALRTKLEGALSFRELLGRVREVTLGAYAHQELPFERLVEELQPSRDTSRTPIFQVLFLFQNMPQEDLELPELKVEAIGTGLAADNSEWVVTDLVLSVQEEGNGLTLGCKYDPDLYDAETVRRLLEHLSILVDSITGDPNKEISQLPMLSDTESRQLLSEWDLSRVGRTRRCVHELFEEQAARHPEVTAVSINNRLVSYRELSERSDQIAHGLGELGIARGQAVAVMLDDGALQVASLLGVLKAGAHFVCLDPHYPLARLQQILAELTPSCVLASGAHVRLLREVLAAAAVKDNCIVIVLEGQSAGANGDAASSLRDGTRWLQRRLAAPVTNTTTPDDLAYIVYTSGSTGRPKGIMQSHDGLCQYVEFQARRFDIRLSKRVAQWASLSYDAAYAEIFGALCAGATLCMTDTTVRSEPRALLEWLREERVNVLITVPSFAGHLFQLIKVEGDIAHPLRDLECLLLAGEALPVAFAREWIERFEGLPRLFNLYGPTESILATCYEVTTVSTEQPSIPVGGAMDGRHILILDRDQQLAPVGGRGEIYIRSPYLTKGYLGQSKETARVFIQNPLNMDHPDPVYRTGDLGRWLPSGVIELMGRADNQVKIRGMRVELEEIEAAAARHPSVAECAVVVREQTGAEPRLIACVVPANHLAASELRTFLKEQLPAHMVPADFAFLPSLPRTRSGKVDRQSLAVAEVYTLSDDRDFVAPRTNFEIAVACIWKELLNVERVGIHDNFFDLGGHSLSATQVVNQLRNLFSVEIQLRDFFESPTVAELALLIEAQQQTDEPAELANLAGLLEMVKQLPDSEVEKLLRDSAASPEHP